MSSNHFSNKKLKIVWLHSHFLYWMGGTKFIHEMVNRLKKRAEVRVFVEKTSPKVRKKFKEIGINPEAISSLTSTSPLYWAFLPYFLWRNTTILKEKTKDVNVVVSSMFPMNWAAAKLGKPTVQYIFEPFAPFFDENFVAGLPFPKREGSKLLAFLYSRLDKEAVRAQNRVLTLSQTTRDQMQKIYGVDAAVTYEGVDTQFFRPKEDEELRRKYQGYRLIVHSTDFSPMKGTVWTLRALAEVVKEFPKTKLLITSTIDDQREIGRLKKIAKEMGVERNIEFLGFVDYELLPVYYTMADVYLHTGIGEAAGATTMSLPVKEALACQTPVVRSPETKEEVIHGESGFLVDPKKPKKVAGAIVKILNSPEMAKRMGVKGRERIVAHFTWDAVADIIWKNIAEAAR